MKCTNCDGTGSIPMPRKGNPKATKTCFFCDGSGELCDVCGEPSQEPGQNVCNQCQRDAQEENK